MLLWIKESEHLDNQGIIEKHGCLNENAPTGSYAFGFQLEDSIGMIKRLVVGGASLGMGFEASNTFVWLSLSLYLLHVPQLMRS